MSSVAGFTCGPPLPARRSVVTRLPGAGLRDLAREVPDLALGIIDALVFKARCYSSLAQMLGTRSLTQRLAQVLLHLAHTYGFEEDETNRGITIAAAFTHAEIANLIGGTRQWVTISLNRLQKAGVLSQKRGLLVIRRIDLLSAAACPRGGRVTATLRPDRHGPAAAQRTSKTATMEIF